MNRDTRTVDDLLREWTDNGPNHLDEASTEYAQLVSSYLKVLKREGFQVQDTKPLDRDLWIEGTWNGEKVGLKILLGGSGHDGIAKGPLLYVDVDSLNVYEHGWTGTPKSNPSGWKKKLEDLSVKLGKASRSQRFTGDDDDITIKDKNGKIVFRSTGAGVKS